MDKRRIFMGQRAIGAEAGIFVIAEIGINHDGSVEKAEKLIDAAAASGADAVKFQSFRADRLLVPSRDRYAQQTDEGESAYQMLRRCELSWEDQEKLKRHADRRGILFLSTPFDEESADFLEGIGVPGFKIASSDLTHIPLLCHVAAKGKPILLSTGMSFLNEVADAIHAIRTAGGEEIVLMHCVSAYPADPRQMNLRALQTLQTYFDLPVGLSDHSEGILVALTSAALGAVVIEKHFTLDKNASGPDHKSSMDAADLKALVESIKAVEASLGDGRKRPADAEREGRVLGRRSVVASADIRAHETIAPWMLTYKRPGTGLEPRFGEAIVGMVAKRDISKDTILQWEDLASPESDNNVAQNELEESMRPQGRRHA